MEEPDYRELIRPAAGHGAEQYSVTITGQIETSRGITWTADLHRNNVTIGTIEDAGDGGAPTVTINDTAEKTLWDTTIRDSYPATDTMAEENFIAHLDYESEGL
jgi:hypothetical protein